MTVFAWRKSTVKWVIARPVWVFQHHFAHAIKPLHPVLLPEAIGYECDFGGNAVWIGLFTRAFLSGATAPMPVKQRCL